MFTAGLELLTCTAELSGPTGPSLGRCRGGGGGAQSCLAAPVCREVFSLGVGGVIPASTPGLVCPKSSPHPPPASSPSQETTQVIKRWLSGATWGQVARAAALVLLTLGTCFLSATFP